MVEEQVQCNKDEAIPLHYQPISGEDKPENLQMTSLISDDSSESWHYLSKGLMFRKAALTFIGLCKLNMSQSQYVFALRCVRSALYCYGEYCFYLIASN